MNTLNLLVLSTLCSVIIASNYNCDMLHSCIQCVRGGCAYVKSDGRFHCVDKEHNLRVSLNARRSSQCRQIKGGKNPVPLLEERKDHASKIFGFFYFVILHLGILKTVFSIDNATSRIFIFLSAASSGSIYAPEAPGASEARGAYEARGPYEARGAYEAPGASEAPTLARTTFNPPEIPHQPETASKVTSKSVTTAEKTLDLEKGESKYHLPTIISISLPLIVCIVTRFAV